MSCWKKKIVFILSVKLWFQRLVWFQQISTKHHNSSSTPPLRLIAAHLIKPLPASPSPKLLSVCGKAHTLFFMVTFQPVYLPHNSSTSLCRCVYVCVSGSHVPSLPLRHGVKITTLHCFHLNACFFMAWNVCAPVCIGVCMCKYFHVMYALDVELVVDTKVHTWLSVCSGGEPKWFWPYGSLNGN